MVALEEAKFSQVLDTPITWLAVAYVGLTIMVLFWEDFTAISAWIIS